MKNKTLEAVNNTVKEIIIDYEALETRAMCLNNMLTTISVKQREEIEKRARVSQRLEALLEILPGGVIVIDQNGLVVQSNPQAANILGVELLVNQKWAEIIKTSFAPKFDDSLEVSLQNGKRISVATNPLPEDLGQIILITDLTKTRELQAVNYLVKPFMPESLISLAQRNMVGVIPHCDEPIAESAAMKVILQMAERVALTHVTVLLTGASGVGKEVVAKYIHKSSLFKQGPFVAVNCAAIPDNMLEAMLFGYEKGAFTGAYNASAGKFELAQNGTLLLDEISEMPLALQAKLLRVLQEKEVERLGGKKNIPLNVRVIAATNKNLRAEVEAKKFREDLFFRLNVFPINIPALDARKEDILPLTNRILAIQSEQLGCKMPELMIDAQEHLLNRKWLGNVRELENVLQRAMVVKNTDQISRLELSIGDFDEIMMINHKTIEDNEHSLDNMLRDQEYDLILKALQNNNGHREATAKELGISSRTLRYKLVKMKEAGFNTPNLLRVTRGDNA